MIMMSCIEKRQIKISAPFLKVETLAFSHPFTRQVDVVFPAGCRELEDALSRFRLTNAKGRVDLARVYDAGPGLQRQNASPDARREGSESSTVLALSLDRIQNNQSRDVWCIDTRGVLTACVDKETYEKLGFVGRKLTFKHLGNDGRYVISVPLHWNDEGSGGTATATATPTRSRVRRILESWDQEFNTFSGGDGPSTMQQGSSSKGAWNVVYCSTDPDINHDDTLEQWTSQMPVIDPTISKVGCEKNYLEGVWIPNLSSSSSSILSPKPNPKNQKDESEDWENDVSALYEWVGMAGLHADRLFANDRVDPYIALYEPPADSRVGNIVHLRWTGFLPPKFVQSLIDTTSAYLKNQPTKQPTQPSSNDEIFVSIVVHGITRSPVAYLSSASASPPPRNIKSNKEKSEPRSSSVSASIQQSEPPAHLPRNDGDEDTWCLIMIPAPPMGNAASVACILVESVGQWDARWG